MKRIISGLLVISFVLLFAACKKDGGTSSNVQGQDYNFDGMTITYANG